MDLNNPRIAYAMSMADKNAFMKWNGIQIEEIDEQHCVASMLLRQEQTNPIGFAHGGILFTIADVLASALARADGRNYVTLGADIHFMKNVREGRLIGEATVLQRGRTSLLCEVVVRSGETETAGSMDLCRVSVTMFCIGRVVE